MNVAIQGRTQHFRTVTFDSKKNAVLLVEQRLLPHEFKIVATKDYIETAAAITDMVVRGAGAIGATAAYGLAQGALAFRGDDAKKFSAHVKKVYGVLKDARPTAIDPVNAMNDVCVAMQRGKTAEEKKSLALAAAEEFANQDVQHCEEIGKHLAKLLNGSAGFDALQCGLAGVCGCGHSDCADVCRTSRGKKVPCVLR